MQIVSNGDNAWNVKSCFPGGGGRGELEKYFQNVVFCVKNRYLDKK